jgi:hypothetical protein
MVPILGADTTRMLVELLAGTDAKALAPPKE